MNRKRKILPIVLFVFLFSLIFFRLFLKNLSHNLNLSSFQNEIRSGKIYLISPLELDLSKAAPIDYLSYKRPVSLVNHLREFLREGRFFGNIDENWEFLTTKCVKVLQGYDKAKILKNYEDIDQLEAWYKENKPQKWEFWKAHDFESWESILAEFYFLTNEEIKFINREAKDKTGKIEKLTAVGGITRQHNKRLKWIIESRPISQEEREYLTRLNDNIFSNLFGKIYNVVPEYKQGLYSYSLLPMLKERSFGFYNLRLETNWYPGRKSKILVNIGGIKPERKEFTVENRYGLEIGNIPISLSTEELAITISLPPEAIVEKNPKIWLKRVDYFPGEEPQAQINKISHNSYKVSASNLSTEQKERLIHLRKFGWFISRSKLIDDQSFEFVISDWSDKIYFLLFLFLLLLFFCLIWTCFKRQETFLSPMKYLKKLAILKKIIIFPFKFLLNLEGRYLYIFVYIYVLGVFLAGKNWDFLAVWTFFFWTTGSLALNLSSVYSFLIALGLMLSGPVFITLKKESSAETTAVFAYFFLSSGFIKNCYEEYWENDIKTRTEKKYWVLLENFYMVCLLSVVILIVFIFGKEVFFYKYFFGNNFMKEFIKRNFLSLLGLWIAAGVGLKWILGLIIKGISKLKIKIQIKGLNDKKIKIVYKLLLALTILFISKIQLSKTSESFKSLPYITKVFPLTGSPGTKVTVVGHNFLDPEKKGSLLLNGTDQEVEEWSNEKIVFEITDKYSDTGDITVKNLYSNNWAVSNKIPFVFIDTSPPVEKELDI